jgi:hypothetical protein
MVLIKKTVMQLRVNKIQAIRAGRSHFDGIVVAEKEEVMDIFLHK